MPTTLNNAGRAKLSKKWKSRFSLIGAYLPVTSIEGEIASATSSGAAMTMTTASPPASGRRAVKFTPQAIEKIKEFVAEGISRDEIANRLRVTVGSLQVTCSRLGVIRHRWTCWAGFGRSDKQRYDPQDIALTRSRPL